MVSYLSTRLPQPIRLLPVKAFYTFLSFLAPALYLAWIPSLMLETLRVTDISTHQDKKSILQESLWQLQDFLIQPRRNRPRTASVAFQRDFSVSTAKSDWQTYTETTFHTVVWNNLHKFRKSYFHIGCTVFYLQKQCIYLRNYKITYLQKSKSVRAKLPLARKPFSRRANSVFNWKPIQSVFVSHYCK